MIRQLIQGTLNNNNDNNNSNNNNIMRINDNYDGDDDDDNDDDDDDDGEDDKTTYQGTHSFQLSLRRTPLGPAVSVHLREMSILQRVTSRVQRKTGTKSRCPSYKGIG